MALIDEKPSPTAKRKNTSKKNRSSGSSPKVSDLEQTISGLREELNELKNNNGTTAELAQARKDLEEAKAELVKLKTSAPQDTHETERHPFFGC